MIFFVEMTIILQSSLLPVVSPFLRGPPQEHPFCLKPPRFSSSYPSHWPLLGCADFSSPILWVKLPRCPFEHLQLLCRWDVHIHGQLGGVWSHLGRHGLVAINQGMRPYDFLGPALQSGGPCNRVHSSGTWTTLQCVPMRLSHLALPVIRHEFPL